MKMKPSISTQIKKIKGTRTISSPFQIARNFFIYNLKPSTFKPFLPRAICFYVTYRCNMRCSICGIWQQTSKYTSNELSLAKIDQIFSDPLFFKIEFVNLNGGEPNLRTDLVEIADLIIKKLPNLKTLTISSNGSLSKKTAENAEKISRLCQENNIRFSVCISLHKIGAGYDEIAGIKDAFFKVKETLDILKILSQENNFYISINCVVSNFNLFNLEEMLSWSKTEQIPVHFNLGEVRGRFYNQTFRNNIEIKEKDKKSLIVFFRNLAKSKQYFLQHALRYTHMADMLEFNRDRVLACQYAMAGVILGSDGSLFYCKDSEPIGNCQAQSALKIYYDKNNLTYRKKKIIKEKCKSCIPNTFNRIELEKDILKFLIFLIKR
jgi:molybdenum cofactor biosynthesis enzyme MoaA